MGIQIRQNEWNENEKADDHCGSCVADDLARNSSWKTEWFVTPILALWGKHGWCLYVIIKCQKKPFEKKQRRILAKITVAWRQRSSSHGLSRLHLWSRSDGTHNPTSPVPQSSLISGGPSNRQNHSSVRSWVNEGEKTVCTEMERFFWTSV